MQLQYTLIKSVKQYNNYCKKTEHLLNNGSKSKAAKDEIELLTLLIEKYDEAHTKLDANTNPVQLIVSLMEEANMKAVDLALMLGVSKGLVSDILNYKKGMSKEIIRKLSAHFKIRQEVLNQIYSLSETKTNKQKNYAYSFKSDQGFAVAREGKSKYGKVKKS